MEEARYLIGLGRSYTTSADNAVLIHRDRQDALDGDRCLLLPRLAEHPLEKQTPRLRIPEHLRPNTIGYR